MRFEGVRLADFRNIAAAELDFAGAERVFLAGANGQGKTNLLEALGLVPAVRSFRTASMGVLIRHGQRAGNVRYRIGHEREGEADLRIELAREAGRLRKRIAVDGEPVRTQADFAGRFPVTVLANEDIQWLRGPPAGRRRLVDLALASCDARYFASLRRYHAALRERNELLKEPGGGETLGAFEAMMAGAAPDIIQARRRLADSLAPLFGPLYAQVAGAPEEPAFLYHPALEESDQTAFRTAFANSRENDYRVGTTSIGPHRDRFDLRLDGHPAASHASEGQQRLLVIALRLALHRWQRAQTGIEPVLLADDILGELDPARRKRFWAALGGSAQVIATGTALPPDDSAPWRCFTVEQGRFRPSR